VIDVSKAMRIDGWTEGPELEWLARQALLARTVIEVGSYLGRSARALSDHCRGVVYCVDLWGGFDDVPDPRNDAYYNAFLRNLGDRISDGAVVPIRTDSLLWAPDLTADLVFLDGDHECPRVTSEILKYGALVAPGGILCGHDYSANWPGVVEAVDRMFPGAVRRERSIWWVKKEEDGTWPLC